MAKQSRHKMFTKSHLVAFGNYLLKTYGVQVHSSDGKNQPVYQREVTDADLSNWKEDVKADGLLPSRFQHGDPVVVHFRKSGIIQNCKVIKIHFTESKVSYDLEVKWEGEDGDMYTDRLYNIDSAVVFPPDHFDMPQSTKQKEANFVVRLKAHVEKCLKESGLPPYDLREEWRTKFFDRLGEGAVDALKIEDCVEKYIPKQKS